MSAKGRGTKPIANDAYPTPPWAVHRLLEVGALHEVFQPGVWLEPASGSGAIIDAIGDHELFYLIDTYPRWTAIDINPIPDFDRRVNRLQADFLDPMQHIPIVDEGGPKFDVAITNPPFSLAFEFARKMTLVASHSFLLTRLSILEAGKRSGRLAWLKANMPDVYVLPDRPCFSHKAGCGQCELFSIAWNEPTPKTCKCGSPIKFRTAGTDATGYCWLHWDSAQLSRSHGLITHLAETPASERVDRVVKL